MTYDIIGQCSIRPAAALGSLRCGSGLAATLPRLCRPEPALADTLAPYPLSLRDRHHAGAAPAVAPHPDVDLEKPAACPAVLPGISSSTGGNKVSEAERNRVVTVSLKVARNKRDSA